MAEKALYRYIASFGAIAIYLMFAYFLVDFIKSNQILKKDYGYDVDDAVVVELSAPEKKKPQNSPKPKQQPVPTPPKPIEPTPPKIAEPVEAVKEVKKVEEESKEQQKEQVSRDIVAKSAKDLFSTVRTEKYDKVLDEHIKEEATRASRLKKQKAKEAKKREEEKKRKAKILAAAHATMQVVQESAAASHKKSGEVDAFWSPVNNRIQALWERTISTQDGLSADVKITIDNMGKLTYRITRYSNNSLFDQKLKNFLENLEYETFPKYHGGSSISGTLTLEDKAE